jgi:DNA-binding transcriptional LysR family regulator
MNWDMVQVFCAVARTGSLQGASKQLHVDRTTVGRRVAALEKQLGVSLFHRGREGLSLTPQGHRALAHATHMDTAARALSATATPEHEVVGTVRLAVTEAMGPFLVEQGLLSLAARHPGLRIELHGGNRRLDLATGEADLAVRLDPLKGAQLRARCLNRAPVALFGSKDYLALHRPLKSPAGLSGHRVLLPGGELAGLPEAKWLSSQRGVTPAFVSNSPPALMAAAKQGLGLIAVTALWGEREPALVRLFDVPRLPPRALWLVATAASARRPACVAVSQRLVELFSKAPGA